ncbi:hypothetical protein [Pseudoalteromonas luteoviolacea]|uniref:DUF350 domain-containing protein n=1 Tax=Pseudoalteromonas luteoviolacea S4054 TaxID=1129367 RepID=A0A0F6AIK3_9GAMM|nr:hypothetical protein [Pseudoalteromonas luteoviolacea]AOT07178.1 hypothetical protein S4054249_04595 [Pseudoalteromonas luteoviolacea]AOT12094.1 hypothetical protein S40542_04595 [Pseudoalteromonas luteoviolacea]AOT17007.1 hypothetical protein S4054_04595 [Pseudoalteromonas luteoviolacea]KKE85399.1 hypothetical protein N479_05190 [Pseudoalteromonas luteoviolacea S4054]KZN73747.1 hypothetical protein N481_11600 [Pseudoalteromonas luteoviolacea S4047-1]
MSYLSLENSNFFTLLSGIILAFVALICLRIIVQVRAKKLLQKELAQHDNFALGINYAAKVAVVCGSVGYFFGHLDVFDLANIHLQILLPMALIWTYICVGQAIHRKWILYRFNETQAILKQNVCAALVDSGMLIGNSILVLGLYHWLEPNSPQTLLIVSICFIFLQGVFALDSKIRESRFAKKNQGASLQYNFSLANTSIGIRYAGKTIGLALAIYAGLHSAPSYPDKIVDNLLSVVTHSVFMWFLLYVFSRLMILIVLPKVDIGLEVDHQDNIGIACLEFAVFCSMGYLLINMFSI